MKKTLLAAVVAGCAAFSGAALADDGQVKFLGEIIDAGCDVVNDMTNPLEVHMGQIAKTAFSGTGSTAAEQDFSIKLEDCDTTVSQEAAVIFNGQQDGTLAGSLANTAGAGAATNVALQLYGPDGQPLNIGDTSGTVTLIDGENVVPLSVDYIATGAVVAGNVSATATFSMVYS